VSWLALEGSLGCGCPSLHHCQQFQVETSDAFGSDRGVSRYFGIFFPLPVCISDYQHFINEENISIEVGR
jgi:hypothetical protein